MVADVEKPAGGTSASATVGGNFSVNQGETGTEGDGQVKPESRFCHCKCGTGEAGAPDENVKQVTVSVDNNALTSVQSAKVDVDIVTDVGTVTLDKDAWNTITEKADGGSVALTVEEKIGGRLDRVRR